MPIYSNTEFVQAVFTMSALLKPSEARQQAERILDSFQDVRSVRIQEAGYKVTVFCTIPSRYYDRLIENPMVGSCSNRGFENIN